MESSQLALCFVAFFFHANRFPLRSKTLYCAGPHCNGANKAAVRLARLGYRVKEMIGGATGWLDEDFGLVGDGQAAAA